MALERVAGPMLTETADDGDRTSLVVPLAPDDRVSEVVIEAVAEATGEDLVTFYSEGDGALDRLYDSVNPIALDRLVRGETGDVRVSFNYAGCEITVVGYSHVTVRQLE